jgi:hypothetical protein
MKLFCLPLIIWKNFEMIGVRTVSYLDAASKRVSICESLWVMLPEHKSLERESKVGLLKVVWNVLWQ